MRNEMQGEGEKMLEAQAGIEPTYTDLQCFIAV